MLNSTASAQSSSAPRKWQLLPDGYAVVPVQDLRYAAAYRVVSDDWRRSVALELAARLREAQALRAELGVAQEQATLKDLRLRTVAERNIQLEDDLKACAKKRDSLRSWATIGKVFMGVCVAGAGYGIYQTTIQP
jgi:hypothetical protein